MTNFPNCQIDRISISVSPQSEKTLFQQSKKFLLETASCRDEKTTGAVDEPKRVGSIEGAAPIIFQEIHSPRSIGLGILIFMAVAALVPGAGLRSG
jgi:hypothetical protein